MTPSIVLGVMFAGSAVLSFIGAVFVLYANAIGNVTAPGSGSLTGTAILGLASLGFAAASWWSFTS